MFEVLIFEKNTQCFILSIQLFVKYLESRKEISGVILRPTIFLDFQAIIKHPQNVIYKYFWLIEIFGKYNYVLSHILNICFMNILIRAGEFPADKGL